MIIGGLRFGLIASGLAGLALDALLTVIGLGVRIGEVLPVAVQGVAAWVVLGVLYAVSAMDIPVMLFSLQKLALDPKRASMWPLWLTNTLYVSFAGAYGLVALLLTDLLFVCLILSGLGFARFISTLMVLRVK